MGPSIPSTELRLMPSPRTTVGYSSEAIRGNTTNDEDMPILPTQYNAKVTLVSEKKSFVIKNYLRTGKLPTVKLFLG